MTELKIGRRRLEVTNEDRVFFPDAGITKGDLIDYYRRIAGVMLPHLEDRPLTMHRFPDGIEGKDFYQKDASDHFPSWIERERVTTEEGKKVSHVVCNEAATLVYLADQACITPHLWLSRQGKLRHPDRIVFDLDPPGDGDEFETVRKAARTLREFLSDELRLPVFLMTTGSRGLHVVVPIRPDENFDRVRSFARDVADTLAGRHPDSLTTEARKKKRRGRLYLDTARNSYAQTAVAPYAVRAIPGAPVAVPIDPEELGDRDLHPQRYTMKNVFRRLGQKDDPWKGIDRSRTGLSKARKELDSLRSRNAGT